MTDKLIRHMRQQELARRWGVSPGTLANWRSKGRGPGFLKVGGRVVYRLEDIEAQEAVDFHRPAAASKRPASDVRSGK